MYENTANIIFDLFSPNDENCYSFIIFISHKISHFNNNRFSTKEIIFYAAVMMII